MDKDSHDETDLTKEIENIFLDHRSSSYQGSEYEE